MRIEKLLNIDVLPSFMERAHNISATLLSTPYTDHSAWILSSLVVSPLLTFIEGHSFISLTVGLSIIERHL